MNFIDKLTNFRLFNRFKLDWEIIIMVILILVGAIILTRVTRWLINKSFVTASEKLKVDPTRYKFFKNASSFIIWIIAIAAITSLFPKLKSLALTLFAGAGILVAIIGFAAQQAFSNIVNGIFIVMFKPFRVGDLIKVGSFDYGVVEDITLRHTVIADFQNNRIVIPNSIMGSESIINNSIEDQTVCRWVEFGISYDSDVELAAKIIQEVAENHPYSIDNRTKEEKRDKEPMVETRLISFNDSSVTIRAYVWCKDPLNVFRMHGDINREVKKRFDAEGIEIPFPYRTVVYKKDLPKNKKLTKNEDV